MLNRVSNLPRKRSQRFLPLSQTYLRALIILRRGGDSKLTVSVPHWIFISSSINFGIIKNAQSGFRISHESAPSAFFLSRKKYIRELHYFAERGRFELPRLLRACRFSKAVLSTTQPPLQIYFAINQICRYYSCTTKITITFFAFLSKNVILVCVFGLIV